MSKLKPVRVYVQRGIDDLVECLADDLNSTLSRSNSYKEIQQALSVGEEIDSNNIAKLLEVCHNDLKSGVKYAANALGIICMLLARYELQMVSTETLNLCAFEVVNIIDKISDFRKSDMLRVLCYETLIAFPEETVLCLSTSHSQAVISIISSNINNSEYPDLQKQNINGLILKFLQKVLSILPSDEKEEFVKDDLDLWFGKVIPLIMKNLTTSPEHIEILELLAEALKPIDFAENPHWRVILESIYTPEKIPEIMKHFLINDNDVWYRLWIVLIKLLKNQITKVSNSSGSPINSMLPVVEMAFKKEPKYRCQAFKCWNVLIDNFASELIEAYVNKRIKLLIIPLKSSNAKVEETALAKFDTWWYLISKFHSKMHKLIDMVLIPFSHFCFGKNMPDGRPAPLAPGQFSYNMQGRCLQAMVEIFGHNNCECIITLPKLNSKLMTTHILVQFWKDWIHSLNTVIRTVMNDESGATKQHLKCLWKSFALHIAELPDNTVRKDLVEDLLDLATNLLQDYSNNEKVADVFLILMCTLFEEEKILPVLKQKGTEKGPARKILSKLVHPSFFTSCSTDPKALVNKFTTIAQVMFNVPLITPDEVVQDFFKDLPAHDLTLMLWTAISEALCKSEFDISSSNLSVMILWPLKSLITFSDGKCNIAWNSWITLYESLNPNIDKEAIDQEISKLLKRQHDLNAAPSYFHLLALLALLKNKLVKNDLIKCEDDIMLLDSIMKKWDNIKCADEALPSLIDAVMSMLSKLGVNLVNANQVAYITIHTIKLIYQTYSLNKANNNNIIFIDILLKGLENLIKIQSDVLYTVVDELVTLLSPDSKNCLLRNKIVLLSRNIILNNKELDEGIKRKITTAINSGDYNKSINIDTNILNTKSDNQKNFTSPKTVPVRSMKNEPSIVNSVLVNGEEYVVVKSHWKFNPKKLTDNQKEKFKRKREDIPALYQDLSQSQDEFKMATWKTDSQDTSNTTSSKSNSKSATEDISTILKNMPNTDVVPQIIENIYSDNMAKDSNKKSDTNDVDKLPDNDKPKIKKVTLTPKDPKLPRMALKDRVFRNVRNLIEKSGIKQSDNLKSDDLNKTVNPEVLKTPPASKLPSSSIINSAPPNINIERPSRVIKKPKKFDDVQLISLKKRRRSRHSNDDLQCSTEIVANLSQENDEAPCSEPVENNIRTKAEHDVSDEVKSKEGIMQDVETANTNVSNEICTIDDEIGENQDKDNACCKQDVVTHETVTKKSAEITVENVVSDNDKIKITSDVSSENIKEVQIGETNEKCVDAAKISTSENEEKNKNIDTSTPNMQNKKGAETSTKKKRSRIEKQLNIDMVEGHPFLQVQSEKRVTRRIHQLPENSSRRKSLTEKLNKAKIEQNKNEKKRNSKDKSPTNSKSDTIIVEDSQENNSHVVNDLPQSEDVIESSQDSTMTTISVTSKHYSKKNPVVKIDNKVTQYIKSNIFQNDFIPLSDFVDNHKLDSSAECKDDTDLPENKTMEQQKSLVHDLTEEMDTQPIEEKDNSDLMIVNDEKEAPIVINTEDTIAGTETQEMAEADTLSMDVDIESSIVQNDKFNIYQANTTCKDKSLLDNDIILTNTPDDPTTTFDDVLEPSATVMKKSNGTCSPLTCDEQRKKDFLNDTIEISPIKTMSPLKEKKSPSPETSSDFVVIKLATPVQSNGEPFEKCDSPEIFTEDKTSPDKRDQSPPRPAVTVVNSSPSSSLSLKKNRPQMRSNGRAAQMLGLCAPDKLQAIMNSERSADVEEPKRNSTMNTPVRRNLRILYSSVGDNNESQPDMTNPDESEDSENFLKFKRTLPTADCSPSVPILKRKLAEIADEATTSPASKRKRVSFHDPPVSTTVAVTKYIEPGCVRSPQNSAIKRQERQLRASTSIKSAKRLDSVFKLDTVLTKTVESFNVEPSITSIDDAELSSMDTTPVVEIVKTSDLNDIDAICPELLNCADSIINIASDLSSPTMKDLFIKEIEGKVHTIGDLAKMTELEVNRLCIKAPKIKVAKKALSDYVKKISKTQQKESQTEVLPVISTPEVEKINVEIQTLVVEVKDIELQTDSKPVSFICTQTDKLPVKHTGAQTKESGIKTTYKIVEECMNERPDFTAQLAEQLSESSMKEIATRLSPEVSMDLLMERISGLSEDVSVESKSDQRALLYLQDYMLKRFDTKDLLLFCSQILHKIHDKNI